MKHENLGILLEYFGLYMPIFSFMFIQFLNISVIFSFNKTFLLFIYSETKRHSAKLREKRTFRHNNAVRFRDSFGQQVSISIFRNAGLEYFFDMDVILKTVSKDA